MPERTWRWCRRHPLPASLAAAVVLVAVAGFSAVVWEWQQTDAQRKLADFNAFLAKQERDRADEQRRLAERNAAEAEQNRRAAEANLARAEARFEKAQEAVRELMKLGEELIQVHGMDARGSAVLEQALEFKQMLMEEKSADPAVRFETARAARAIGWTQIELGRIAEAEISLRQALEWFRQLYRDNPDSVKHLRELRATSSYLALALQHFRKTEESIAASRETIAFAEKVVKLVPESLDDEVSLANALLNGAVRIRPREPETAAAQVLRAAEINRRAVAAAPTNRHRAELALVLSDLAFIHRTRDRARAEELARESLELRRALVKEAAKPRGEPMYFARSCFQVADICRSTNRPDEAESILREGIQSLEPVVVNFPGFESARTGLADCLNSLRSLLRSVRRHDEADETERRTVEVLAAIVRDFPDDAGIHRRLATDAENWAGRLTTLGRLVEAAESHQRAIAALRRLERDSDKPEPLRSDIRRNVTGMYAAALRIRHERLMIEAVRESLRQIPDNAIDLNLLAWTLLVALDESLRDPREAATLVRRAIELKPDYPFFHNTLGVALFRQGDLTGAREAFEASLRLETTAPAADWYFLAMIHHQQGDRKTARLLYEQARAWHLENAPWDDELCRFLTEARALLKQPQSSHAGDNATSVE